jgi:DNA-binding response OmpR family regulator
MKHAGYEVAVYASTQELLDRLPSDGNPSCILLDVRLPGLSGPELQERLMDIRSTLSIKFISGYTEIPLTVRVLKAGAQDFPTKPVVSNELFRAIDARAAVVRPHRSRQHEQADRRYAGNHRAHDQSSPPRSDGENAGPVAGRANVFAERAALVPGDGKSRRTNIGKSHCSPGDWARQQAPPLIRAR